MVWSCLPFIRSGQNHLARHSERQTKEEEKADKGRGGKTTSAREWTGLEFAKSQRAVVNRENKRKLVARSFVVPQRPSRLRD